MLARRSEVVQYLVEKGHPQNLARVAVEECFNMTGHDTLNGKVTEREDWIWTFDFDSSVGVSKITREFALEMYLEMRKMLCFGPGGIYVHGELKYDYNGDKID